jgi:hypothetical protein
MISEKGFWIGDDVACEHAFDATLCKNLIAFFKDQGGTVCDLGCGMGDYTRSMRAAGITADGYDGNPDTPTLTKGVGKVRDLSTPFEFPEKYDWVLTLEVGEHLPLEYESVFIDNIVNNSKRGIVLSWAVEGQAGHGHFNCRNNDYVKRAIMARGYRNNVATEQWLRSQVDLSWFANTIMVFTKVGEKLRASGLESNSPKFIYGTSAASVDVTQLVQKEFSTGSAFLIPSHASFNTLFGDVHIGMAKQLSVTVAEVTMSLPEARDYDYRISVHEGELRVLTE